MIRIFVTLAWFTVLFAIATFCLGAAIGEFRQQPTDEALTWLRIHKLCGLAAALLVVFVNSVVVTYFIGTSRWCREVVETYKLDGEYIACSNRLKRSAFPWALSAMLVIVGVIALGAAADPGTGRQHTEEWAMPHLLGSIVGIGFVCWAFLAQASRITANHVLINEIVADVARIRAERGL